MRVGLGGMRHGKELLTQKQINTYMLARIIDLEDNEFKMCGALQLLGLDQCDTCEEWSKHTINAGDRCQCRDCFDPWHFMHEDDDQETADQILPSLIAHIRNDGKLMALLPKTKDGALEEPFLSEYRKQTRYL